MNIVAHAIAKLSYFVQRSFLGSTGKYAVWGLYLTDLLCRRDCPLVILRGRSSLWRAPASTLFGKVSVREWSLFFFKPHSFWHAFSGECNRHTTFAWRCKCAVGQNIDLLSLNFDSGGARTCLCEVRGTRESWLSQRSGCIRRGKSGEFFGEVYVSWACKSELFLSDFVFA